MLNYLVIHHVAWITLLGIFLPFCAFSGIMLFARRHPGLSAGISITGISISLAAGIFLLFHLWGMIYPRVYSTPWVTGMSHELNFGILIDPTSLVMFCLVAAICFLVQVYSLGYMKNDPGFWRYYAFQSLFAGAMLCLCLSASLLQLFIFWELVGLCSYLLIGFWIEKFSATQAGKKAFVMTRLGDVSFFLGILLLMLHLGNVDILELNSIHAVQGMSSGLITLCVLLLFGGIIGKSAQFPLLTWLPDAMEGPTPVSALLHSATMVAAGVYLFVRLFPFFSHSIPAAQICLAVGTLSMLMAGTMAMVDRDIKKVWAYSTISQLGYMIMGLSAGDAFAGYFHLLTHAAFKSLLFLCAGVWIHYFETNDMYEIARKNGRGMKIPMGCSLLAAASLTGLPPLSGFFSKEAILAALLHKAGDFWFAAGVFGVFITAYYAFRPMFIILTTPPDPAVAPPVMRDGTYRFMVIPLLVLAFFTAILGFLKLPLAAFLHMPSPSGESLGVTLVSLAAALAGLFLVWFEFGRASAARVGFLAHFPKIRHFLLRRWYLDLLYDRLLRYGIYALLARPFSRTDRQLIDGGIEGIGRLTLTAGRLCSRLQSGILRKELMIMAGVLALTGIVLLVG